MNVLNRLTLKSLLMNKKRTLATIFGIILSTALICAASGLVTSMQKTGLESTKKDQGDYHVSFPDVKKENLKYIQENRNVQNYYCTQGIGYAKLNGSENPDKPYLYLMGFDQNALKKAGLKLMEGRLPENDTEIVISNTIETNSGVTYQIGDVLSLSVGKRISEGDELNQNNPYLTEENGEEHLEEDYQQDYTIVGIIGRLNYTLEPYSGPGYSIITKMDTVKDRADIYVNFTNVQKTSEYTHAIKKTLEKQQKWDLEPVYNRELLRWSGSMIGDGTRTLLFTVGGIVIIIIMISSIFVIRNSFAISITERMRQYGMLASVGATSKQIRKNVFYEGFLLGIIGIPLGILSGILAVFVLLKTVNYILKDFTTDPILYYLPLLPIILAIFLSIVTIYVSAFASARKAAKVSPMEAIRSSQDIKITAKKVKSPKIIKTWFGIGGEISYKNLKRNKRKYRTTVVSMVISIVLFLSMYAFITYGFEYSGIYYSELDYNIGLSLYYEGDIEKEYKLCQELSELDGVNRWSIARLNMEYSIPTDPYVTDLGKKIKQELYDFQSLADLEEDQIEEMNQSKLYICSLGDAEYQRFLTSLDIKDQEKNGAVLMQAKFYYLDDTQVFGDYYHIKQGDQIQASSDKGKNLSFKILAVTQDVPMGMQNKAPYQDYFIVSDSMMDQLGYVSVDMKIQAENPDEMEKTLMERLESKKNSYKERFEYSISNAAEAARQENAVVLVIKIFLYGFITVISLIGITNIFNTITTNMNLREKEFAMLRSVGMTQREFSGMIRMESIFYGAKALLIGLPLGTVCSFLFYKMFDTHMNMPFSLPWRAYLIVVLFVMLIVGLTMKYSFGKIKNKNIIETIRKDTI